jgi:hypothetical protein
MTTPSRYSIFALSFWCSCVVILSSHTAHSQIPVQEYYNMPFSEISIGEPALWKQIPEKIPGLKSGETIVLYKTASDKIVMCFPKNGKLISIDMPLSVSKIGTFPVSGILEIEKFSTGIALEQADIGRFNTAKSRETIEISKTSAILDSDKASSVQAQATMKRSLSSENTGSVQKAISSETDMMTDTHETVGDQVARQSSMASNYSEQFQKKAGSHQGLTISTSELREQFAQKLSLTNTEFASFILGMLSGYGNISDLIEQEYIEPLMEIFNFNILDESMLLSQFFDSELFREFFEENQMAALFQDADIINQIESNQIESIENLREIFNDPELIDLFRKYIYRLTGFFDSGAEWLEENPTFKPHDPEIQTLVSLFKNNPEIRRILNREFSSIFRKKMEHAVSSCHIETTFSKINSKTYHGHSAAIGIEIMNSGATPIYDVLILTGVPDNSEFNLFFDKYPEKKGFYNFFMYSKNVICTKLYRPINPGETFKNIFSITVDPWYIHH